jgi:hypothetical protein
MDRTTILDQLANGQLSAEEAAQLLRGSNQPAGGGGSAFAPSSPLPPLDPNRRLRVRVTNLSTGRDRVNVNLPLTLVEAGLKLGARYEAGIANIDFKELMDEIRAGANGQIVDVENYEDGERVQVFID